MATQYSKDARTDEDPITGRPDISDRIDKSNADTVDAVASDDTRGRDSNPDLITSAPGSHPVATGVGALAAGAAGAAIGSVVPGIGTVVGGVIGAVVGSVGGGYAGKAVGEAIDPTGTDDYWRDEYKSRDYAKGKDYDTLQPAYQYGAALAERSEAADYDDTAARSEWQATPHAKTLDYDAAKSAIRDEFNRKLQLREEQLHVNKERVQSGEVSLRKEVTTERKTIEVPVEREEVVITRHAVNRATTSGETIGEDETIRIPVSEERVNVTKDTVVTGEVEIGKRVVTDTKTVSDDIRKETAKVVNPGNVRVDDRSDKTNA